VRDDVAHTKQPMGKALGVSASLGWTDVCVCVRVCVRVCLYSIMEQHCTGYERHQAAHWQGSGCVSCFGKVRCVCVCVCVSVCAGVCVRSCVCV